ADIAVAEPPEQLPLRHELAVVTDLLICGGEVAMPEERELLFQGALGAEHPLPEPAGHAHHLAVIRKEVEEASIDHRLQPHRARGALDGDAQGLASSRRLADGFADVHRWDEVVRGEAGGRVDRRY